MGFTWKCDESTAKQSLRGHRDARTVTHARTTLPHPVTCEQPSPHRRAEACAVSSGAVYNMFRCAVIHSSAPACSAAVCIMMPFTWYILCVLIPCDPIPLGAPRWPMQVAIRSRWRPLRHAWVMAAVRAAWRRAAVRQDRHCRSGKPCVKPCVPMSSTYDRHAADHAQVQAPSPATLQRCQRLRLWHWV